MKLYTLTPIPAPGQSRMRRAGRAASGSMNARRDWMICAGVAGTS